MAEAVVSFFVLIVVIVSAFFLLIRPMMERASVESAAREVAASIMEAQNYAMVGKALHPDREILCNVRFGVPPASAYGSKLRNRYLTKGGYVGPVSICPKGTIKDTDTEVFIDKKLPDGVEFISVPPTDDVTSSGRTTFSVPFSEVIEPATLPAKYVIGKGSSKYTICVRSSGNVSELAGDKSCI